MVRVTTRDLCIVACLLCVASDDRPLVSILSVLTKNLETREVRSVSSVRYL